MTNKKVSKKQKGNGVLSDAMRSSSIENPCMICGKEVKWGMDGCPVVDKGDEMGVLFGRWKGMQHYKCKTKLKDL